jgi:hypothetical protein
MRVVLSALVLLVLVATGLATSLLGTWRAKSMGSKSGTITFNRDMTYRLELNFKPEKIVQSGKYEVKGDVLTLTPSKGQRESAAPIALKLNWKGDKSVSAIATRPGRKLTEFYFWRE